MELAIVWLIERVALGFVLITVPFYALVLVVIAQQNCTSSPSQMVMSTTTTTTSSISPFFRLMFVTGLVDITTLLNNYLGSVFPKWGLFPSVYLNPNLESALSRLYIGIAWGTGLSHTICILAVALNRMVAIFTLFKYKQIWTVNITRLLYALQIAPGLAICAMIFKDPIHYVLQPDGISIVARNFDESASALYFLIGAICTGFGCLLSAIAYAISFLKLYQYRRQIVLSIPSSNGPSQPSRAAASLANRQRSSLTSSNSTNQSAAANQQQKLERQRNKHRAEEIRLFMLALIICLVEFVLAAVLAFHSSIHNALWIAVFNLLTDLFSGINPYLLWTFSEPLRQKTLILLIGFPGPYRIRMPKWKRAATRKTIPSQQNNRQ